MHKAARGGNVEAIKVLIEQGADIHSTNKVSCYPNVMLLNNQVCKVRKLQFRNFFIKGIKVFS